MQTRKFIFLLGVIILTASLLLSFATGIVFPSAPAISSTQIVTSQSGDVTELVVWAVGDPHLHWRADGPAKAAANVPDYNLKVEGLFHDSMIPPIYLERFTRAARAGQGPDIVVLGLGYFPQWVEAGYIIPFDDCRAQHPEFKDVLDELWPRITRQGHTWGVPLDFSAGLLYFNKIKLKQTGWSEEQIEHLPQKIQLGQFTYDDLIAAAKTAIQQGVVAPGFGFWHRPKEGRMVFLPYLSYGGRIHDAGHNRPVVSQTALVRWYALQRRLVTEGITLENYVSPDWRPNPLLRSFYHEAVTNGQVLFWSEYNWHWHHWRDAYAANQGGDKYLLSFIGQALLPPVRHGQPGSTALDIGFYAITSPQVSGRNHQIAACALLAKTTTPTINTLHAIDSTNFGILKSQATDVTYRQHPHLLEPRYMLHYGWMQRDFERGHFYFDTLWQFMIAAENGEMSPAAAASAAIDQLRREFGARLIVE